MRDRRNSEKSGGARGLAGGGERQEGGQQEKRELETRQDESGVPDTEGLRARLDRLSSALKAQGEAGKASHPSSRRKDNASPEGVGSAMSLAARVLSEFVAAVVVGAVIGWGIDRAAGTSPVFLMVFLLMGAAAGLWNVYRIAMERPGREG